MWTHYNPNPAGRNVGDCTVRALSKALNQDWYTTYLGLCVEGGLMGDMPSANATWLSPGAGPGGRDRGGVCGQPPAWDLYPCPVWSCGVYPGLCAL